MDELPAIAPSQLTEEVTRDDIKESYEYQYRIQYADSCEIPERTEMGNAFFLGWIVHMYGNVADGGSSPCGEDECFKLEFILGGIVPFLYIEPVGGIKIIDKFI